MISLSEKAQKFGMNSFQERLATGRRQFLEREDAYFESFAESRSWKYKRLLEDLDYADDFRHKNSDHLLDSVLYELFRKERDVIYGAVVASGSEMTTIRSSIEAYELHDFLSRGINTCLHVEATPARTKVIYMPVTEMPRDVFECKFCGGWTKNDKRGHCSGCGGPRNLRYLENMARNAW